MKVKLSRKLTVGLMLALSVTATAAYVNSGQEPTAIPPTAIQTGEQNRAGLIANQLRDLLSPAGVRVPASFQLPEANAAKQLTVHWEASGVEKTAAATEQSSGRLAVAAARTVAGNLPRLRSVQLGETEIFLAAVDANQQLVWWHVMSDPRQLRIQTVNATGEISCQVIYQTNIDFPISYPDETSIKEVRLYHPHWTGTKFELLLIGTISAL